VEWGVRDGAAWLAVLDGGPGLGADDAEELFERFARGAAGRSAPGTGLGLAIVRTLARRWGGEAGIGDRPGGGARAEVTLPLAAAPARDEVAVS
jgi:two-component system sensor histidine kinase TctE